MRTDPGIELANTVGKSSRSTGNHRAHAFRFPDSWPGTRPAGDAARFRLADHVPVDEPQARRLPAPRGPGAGGPGTMPPPASEPELNRIYQPPKTEVS